MNSGWGKRFGQKEDFLVLNARRVVEEFDFFLFFLNLFYLGLYYFLCCLPLNGRVEKTNSRERVGRQPKARRSAMRGEGLLYSFLFHLLLLLLSLLIRVVGQEKKGVDWGQASKQKKRDKMDSFINLFLLLLLLVSIYSAPLFFFFFFVE